MDAIYALTTVLDKVTPLQQEKKNHQADVLAFLQARPSGEQEILEQGRKFKIHTGASRQGLTLKFLREVIASYNLEHDDQVSEEFVKFLMQQQQRRKTKQPRPRLSITKA